LASLHNPEFHERQRLRLSTWRTPRFIRCYEEDLGRLHLPRGLVGRVRSLLEEDGSKLELVDQRDEPPSVEFKFHGRLSEAQAVAVSAAAKEELGVLVAPTGAGKTVMACAVIAHHRTPTLILVDRTPLLEQWRDRLADQLRLDAREVGQIGGGRKRTSGVV